MSKIKFIIEIILGICAIISIVLAVLSMKISNEANRTAKNAISVSKIQFIQENRPYIEVHPEKFSNGLYMEFVENGKQCEINLMYKLENVGKGPATDILCPQLAKFSEEMLKKGNILKEFIPPPSISLAPGEDVKMVVNQTFVPNDVTVEEYLRGYKDGTYYFSYDFQVIYRSEINKDEIYSTKSRYRIYEEKAILESYKHIKINDPTYVNSFNSLFHKISEK